MHMHLHVNYIDIRCTVTSEKWIRESGQFSTPIIHFFNIPRYWTANTGNLDTANHRRFAQHLFRLEVSMENSTINMDNISKILLDHC